MLPEDMNVILPVETEPLTGIFWTLQPGGLLTVILASVTIIGDSGVLCDALSTAIFVMGLEEGIQYWETYGGFDMLLMTLDGEIYLTEGIEENFTPEEEFSEQTIHVMEA